MGDMKVIKLGDLCKIVTGKKDVNEGNPSGYYPFFTCSRHFTFSDGYSFDDEAILIAGNGDVGNLHYYKGKFEAYQRTYVLTDFKTDVHYIYYFLEYGLVKALQIERIGTSIPYIKLNHLKDFIISCPDIIQEQSTIATILSNIDQAIEKTEHLIAKYERIKTGLMQDLLTRGIDEQGRIRSEETHAFKDSPLGRIPVEWEVVNFGQYVELIHGYQFRNFDFTESGIPIVKISQVTEEGLDLSNASFISKERLKDFEKQVIRSGDVLMALTGATLGKACLVTNLSIPVLQNYRVGRFEPVAVNSVDKAFLYYILTTKAFLNQIFAKVNTGAQGNIGKSDFVKAKLILPKYEEQERIASALTQIQRSFEVEYCNLEKNRILKKALMQDLLTGRVRVDGVNQISF